MHGKKENIKKIVANTLHENLSTFRCCRRRNKFPIKVLLRNTKRNTLFRFHCLELYVAQKRTEYSLLCFHGYGGYANVPRRRIIGSLPVLLALSMINNEIQYSGVLFCLIIHYMPVFKLKYIGI